MTYLKRVFCLFFLVLVFSLHAQNVSLIPKDVYVGDEAEIRFSFDWDGKLLVDSSESFTTVVTSSTIDESLENNYTIQSIQIFSTHTGYEVSIQFIPWKAGTLDLDAFDLATFFDISTSSLLIDIPEVQIQSILENTSEKEIRAPLGPVIIPGTTYVLVAIGIIILLACLLIIIVLARLSFIKAWVKSFFGKIWASDNFKKASKELLHLSKQSETLLPKVFAAKLSVVVRTYLEGRFSHRFTAETTSSFFMVFDELFAGTVSRRASEYLQDLYEICVRCDFLHYAGQETEKAPLTQQEAASLIERTRAAIIYFEKDTDSEDEQEGVLV